MSFFKSLKAGFHLFGEYITTIINVILLTFVYLIGVGITAIIAKLSGKKFMETKLGKKSYWEEYGLKKEKKENYLRQF
jgi:cytochrome c biogenesis protein CcdA